MQLHTSATATPGQLQVMWVDDSTVTPVVQYGRTPDALALTAVLGILSYLMQAKIQRDAERTEKAREQAHSDNVRAEARAAQLLARVQNQMQHYVRPLIQSHVSLSAFTDHFRHIYPYGSGSTAMTPSVVSLQPLV